jgi:Mn2+/Fe2+ NRAMP family transporter
MKAARSGRNAIRPPRSSRRNLFKVVGLGLITGAADDDPSGIGTDARFGTSLDCARNPPHDVCRCLPVLQKRGQVTGQGLFRVIRTNYSRWFLYPTLIGVLIGNAIEAGADIG